MTMTLERKPTGPVSFALPFTPASAREARRRLRQWLDALGADPDSSDDARLLISELVGNAVRHARPLADDSIEVAWTAEDSALALSVTDGGSEHSAPAVQEAAGVDVSGRGLAIVEALADRWWIETDEHRTTVHCLLPLD